MNQIAQFAVDNKLKGLCQDALPGTLDIECVHLDGVIGPGLARLVAAWVFLCAFVGATLLYNKQKGVASGIGGRGKARPLLHRRLSIN